MTSETMNVSDLSIPQLQELVRQYEKKIQFISGSVHQLKSLQAQFAGSKDCLKQFTPEAKDSDVMVPLTSTLCVPGKLTDPSRVLIDIGTGYYAELVGSHSPFSLVILHLKTIEQAEAYFVRRMETITKHVQEVSPALEEKTQIYRTLSAVLDSKVKEFVASRAAATGAKS